MAFLVERMEKCLRAWEDLWFLIEAINTALSAMGKPRLSSNEGAVVNAPKFRKRLLKNRREKINLSDFIPPRDLSFPVEFFSKIPLFISSWCQHSRRLYHITKELQAVLNATSLEGVTWQDVSFPFPAYSISLQQPVTNDEDSRLYDFVMVNALPREGDDGQLIPSVELIGLSQECERYEPMTEANRQNIRNRIKSGEWEHVVKICTHYLKNTDPKGLNIYFWGRPDLEVMSTAQWVLREEAIVMPPTIRQASKQEAIETFWESMVRIAVGMCLYLKTLSPQSPHQSEWRPVPRSGLPDPRAISNEAQVCTVSSCYKLTTEERVVLGLEGTKQERAAYELSCHFRQGHWRRAPGYGHLPDAPKTVHVRPCIVRKDRLREGELPGGSQAII